MSGLTERTHRIAVSLGKAENYRVSTAKLVAELADYLRTDDGAAEAVAAGVSPTLENVFELLIRTDEAYPSDVFGSFSSFKRLLRIGRAPDPVMQDQSERDQDAESHRRVRKGAALRPETLQAEDDPLDGEEWTALDPKEVEWPKPNHILRAWQDFPAQRAEFVAQVRANGELQ